MNQIFQNGKYKCCHYTRHIRIITLGTKFHFKKTALSFGPNLSKKDVYRSREDKETSPLNSTYLNPPKHQVSSYTTFNFRTQFAQKGCQK